MRLRESERLWTRSDIVPRARTERMLTLPQKFTQPLPTYDPLFTSHAAKEALDRTVALHFLRTGQFSTAETFIEVRRLCSASGHTGKQTHPGVWCRNHF